MSLEMSLQPSPRMQKGSRVAESEAVLCALRNHRIAWRRPGAAFGARSCGALAGQPVFHSSPLGLVGLKTLKGGAV